MSVISMIRLMIFIGILPFGCGMYLAGIHGEARAAWVRTYVYGWLVLFASFEFVCVPFVVRLGKFSAFTRLYNLVVWLLFSASVILWIVRKISSRKRENGRRVSAKAGQSAGAVILWIIILMLLTAQMIYLYFYQHLNGDDAYYVAQSVLTDYHDTMFQRDSYTGAVLGLDVRHALSAIPVFITWLSRMCGIHPTIMCHSILAPVLLALMYGVYLLLGQQLFRKNRAYVPVFLLFLNIWYLWGNVSIYTSETFAYTRTWQGKSVFANIIIPLAFYFLLELLANKKAETYALLSMLSVAGVLVTTASVYLLSMLYIIAGIWALITQRQKKTLMYLILCCVPSLVYGALYCYLLYRW